MPAKRKSPSNPPAAKDPAKRPVQAFRVEYLKFSNTWYIFPTDPVSDPNILEELLLSVRAMKEGVERMRYLMHIAPTIDEASWFAQAMMHFLPYPPFPFDAKADKTFTHVMLAAYQKFRLGEEGFGDDDQAEDDDEAPVKKAPKSAKPKKAPPKPAKEAPQKPAPKAVRPSKKRSKD